MMKLENARAAVAAESDLSRYVRAIPDFPKPGILFRDITPLLSEPEQFRELISRMALAVRESGAERIVGLESRGFIFGIAIAQALGLPFTPARKAGKLPGETISVAYALEYGEQRLELQRDAVKPGERVAIVDDLLATGGTAAAAAQLVRNLGGEVSGFHFAIELGALSGREKLNEGPVHSELHF